MPSPIPSGTVTFLFTDIEGSTQLWESAPDAMRSALERHDTLLRGAIDAHEGYVFSTGGDGFAVAFGGVEDAVRAAEAMQEALAGEPWPAGAPLRVRMGIHTGQASERDGDYFGQPVNRTARLMSIAHGGQVVCSQATATLLDPATTPLRPLGAHRLRDLAAPETVYQLGDGTFPPLRSVDAVPTNLPTVRTDLIGRQDELTDLTGLLQTERLVTLTGTGGVGKTRLALGVAAALATGFADGSWLVELAPVSDPDEVANAVAAAMRAPTTGTDALVSYLAERRMLLVLDNCEHVLDAAADLADAILAAAPEVTLIATSREPLGLDGEQIRRVQSLGLPAADAALSAASEAPSVRLFAERAGAVRHGFRIDPDNLAAVVEICRHLDGIPLAIELAAARVRAMAPAEIARRLDERFRLLAGGSRRAQERHRTLLATVSWSHDLLGEDERTVFRRLAVFPATFDLAAAEAIAGGEGIDAVDAVLRLVDRSLVVYEASLDRYRLLETLRQYGADRLAEAGEAHEVRERHARHFLSFVEQMEGSLGDARYPAARAATALELDNIRAAVEWCSDHARWAELAAAVRRLWFYLGQEATSDRASWYRLLVAHGDQLDGQVLVEVLAGAAWLEVQTLGNPAAGIDLAEQSTALAAELGVLSSPWAANSMTMATLYTGDNPEALRLSKIALRLADEQDDLDSSVTALCTQINLCSMLGDDALSGAAADEAWRRAETTGHPVHTAAITISVCSTYLLARSAPDFEASYEVLTRADRLPETGEQNNTWRDLMWGGTLLGLGDPRATTHLGRAAHGADRQDSGHVLEFALRLLAIAAAEAGLTRQAAALADYADVHLQVHRIQNPIQEWIQSRLDQLLEGVAEPGPDRASHRGEAMDLVNEVTEAIASELPEGEPV